ncbi:MAG: signal recognition particle-docking protein FtsY [Erysipelotrichaceae bacterium]
MNLLKMLKQAINPKTNEYIKVFDSTNQRLGFRLKQILKINHSIDESFYTELMTVLLESDVGVETGNSLINQLKRYAQKESIIDPSHLIEKMIELMRSLFNNSVDDLDEGLNVILIVGVNGSGKTTTIAKLAHHYRELSKSVVVAAADTFRAAAVEQLAIWCNRLEVPCIVGKEGADPSSVVVDALRIAIDKKADILLIDTAGRLQNNTNLMEELAKMNRVITKIFGKAPKYTWMILDASTGQNAMSQANAFLSSVSINGIICTKMDGTAKGGILMAISQQMHLPISFIGTGEQVSDLIPFDRDSYIYSIMRELKDESG